MSSQGDTFNVVQHDAGAFCRGCISTRFDNVLCGVSRRAQRLEMPRQESSRSPVFFQRGEGPSPKMHLQRDPSLRLKNGSAQDDP